MARLPRLMLAGETHHVIHRGNNRQPIVQDDEDRQRLLDLLRECAQQHQVALHGYVLMENHFHLLATPAGDEGLSSLMQALGRRYVAAFNLRHGRSGTLWEGRFRANLVAGSDWVLACLRYIELNPVRIGHSNEAGSWRWSSAQHHLGRRRDPLITEHPAFWSLGNTPFEREHVYRGLLEQGLRADEASRITQCVLRGWPLADEAQQPRLEAALGSPVTPRPRGRPRKSTLPGLAE